MLTSLVHFAIHHCLARQAGRWRDQTAGHGWGNLCDEGGQRWQRGAGVAGAGEGGLGVCNGPGKRKCLQGEGLECGHGMGEDEN